LPPTYANLPVRQPLYAAPAFFVGFAVPNIDAPNPQQLCLILGVSG
jgi:hypothetical protein